MRIKKAKNSASLYNSIVSSQSGFTLVELLIVIVIIGILAGVVIGVLNPVQQQNRARDGATRAQIDKMALSTKSLYVSSPRTIDRAPTLGEFGGGIASSADITNCTGSANANVTNGAANCVFQITGQPLPNDCSTTYGGSGGGTQCSYFYWRTNNEFRIAARGAANPVSLFVYEYLENAATGNVTEGFWNCGAAFNVANAAPTTGGGCTQIN